jgi:Flp pilus assembly protein TadG
LARLLHRDESGQLLIVFTIALVAIIASAGLLIDGGMAWTNRRMAQSAADTAALAAAKTLATGGTTSTMTTDAKAIAASNLFPANYTNCAGQSQTNGVVVNAPPTSGAFANQSGYVEVIVNRPMRTSFSAIVGQNCWMVSARAVASISNNNVASCNFCSLNNTSQNHTLVLKNSATLRVDGDIYVNSTNGGTTPGVCATSGWKVCGDAFDVFGTGGTISAKTIAVVGGWETHDQNIAVADGLAPGCAEDPQPPSQLQWSNVCIHMPVLADPLNDPARPGSAIAPPTAGAKPVAGVNGCPAGAAVPSGTAASPSLMTISSGSHTICPGTYYGGLKISAGTATMQPGVYIMVGGGFQVINTGSVDGRAGVMIYSEGGGSASQSTTTANDLVPPAIPGHSNLGTIDVASSLLTANVGDIVTFKTTLTPPKAGNPAPTGTVDVYDGNVQICSATPVAAVQLGKNIVFANCVTSFAIYGTRAISAVYSGDSYWNAAGDTLSEVIKTPAGTTTGPITIDTTGKVDIFGPKTGSYSGLTLFQERNSNLTVTLAPGNSNAGKCGAGFMTKGVPPDASAVPDACGAIGGLQGTVYAPNPTALVLIEASGLANLQVIAGMIEVDSGAYARFGYNGALFANGSIHLVE